MNQYGVDEVGSIKKRVACSAITKLAFSNRSLEPLLQTFNFNPSMDN